jgi:hypothetical protein
VHGLAGYSNTTCEAPHELLHHPRYRVVPLR